MQQLSRDQQLRAEFQAQRADGVANYTLWLEERILQLETKMGLVEMAADQNFQLWKAAEKRCERLRYGGG